MKNISKTSSKSCWNKPISISGISAPEQMLYLVYKIEYCELQKTNKQTKKTEEQHLIFFGSVHVVV